MRDHRQLQSISRQCSANYTAALLLSQTEVQRQKQGCNGKQNAEKLSIAHVHHPSFVSQKAGRSRASPLDYADSITQTAHRVQYLFCLSEREINMDFDTFLQEMLKDSEFRAEYEACAPQFSIMTAIVNARLNTGMTSEQLAEASGIHPSYFAKLERSSGNPSLRTLQRLAAGMGMRLKLEFEPITN